MYCPGDDYIDVIGTSDLDILIQCARTGEVLGMKH